VLQLTTVFSTVTCCTGFQPRCVVVTLSHDKITKWRIYQNLSLPLSDTDLYIVAVFYYINCYCLIVSDDVW